jgi:hypothetical protein
MFTSAIFNIAGYHCHLAPISSFKNINETPRSKLRGISTKDIFNNNAASSGVFTLRENKIYKNMVLCRLNKH